MLGEETVLLKALEGKRGQPEQRPPHPAERGLNDMPTVVNNVQTLATVPWIIRNGADRVRRDRAPGRRAARSSSRSGRPPATASPRSRSGPRCARSSGWPASCRAAVRSRPSSSAGRPAALLPQDLLDTPYAFEPLREAGAHVGSGSVVVADDRACVVDLARLLTRFCAERGVRQDDPVPDRHPPPRRDRRSGDRRAGRGRRTRPCSTDLSADIVASALCDHERLTTLPLASGMRYFRSELDDHILRSSCPAGVCHPIAVAAGAAS